MNGEHRKYHPCRFRLPKIFHILVIEDGSPDGTANIVKTLQQEFPERLFMIERKGKLGLGTALYRRIQVGTGTFVRIYF